MRNSSAATTMTFTYPEHLLSRRGILLQRIEQLDSILRRFVRSDALGERLDPRFQLALIHLG